MHSIVVELVIIVGLFIIAEHIISDFAYIPVSFSRIASRAKREKL